MPCNLAVAYERKLKSARAHRPGRRQSAVREVFLHGRIDAARATAVAVRRVAVAIERQQRCVLERFREHLRSEVRRGWIPANTCPECGAPMVYETRPDTIEYGGEERVFPMLAWWCTECDEAIFEGQPLADREKAFLELKAEVDEVLSPSQVAAVRTKLGLSQRKAGELLGGGPRSF
jgi:putative zinc finger/helix-turn-helix YgiT family protein